ncbi:MAG TPA: ribonuclease E/G [Tissierellaceae bacterium]
MDYIFIDDNEENIKFGLVENNKLMEFFIENKDNKSLIGNIYRARVQKVIKGIDAAFIDINQEENGYLPLKSLVLSEDKRKANLSKIKGGDSILVEVKKDPTGKKGAFLTRDITFTGNYIVLTPFDSAIKISRKIDSKEDIYRLLDFGQKIKKDNLGMVFRTNAKNVSKSTLENEYNSLIQIYNKVMKEKDFLPVPKLIYKEPSRYISFIRGIKDKNKYKIYYNNKTFEKEFENYLKDDINSFKSLEYNSEFNTDYNLDISLGLAEALGRCVRLDNGIDIVIDELEALTAIDVNSASYTGNLSLEETKLDVNLKVIPEIARQIRLRNLSGIILIDFISLSNLKNQNLIIEKLKEEVNKDSNRPYIIGFTKLGLLEITRKRNYGSLRDNMLKKCNICEGFGYIK